MPRPKKLDRPVSVRASIPESLFAKVQIELYSELEGGVPYGAMSNLMTKLISDWLVSRGVIL